MTAMIILMIMIFSQAGKRMAAARYSYMKSHTHAQTVCVNQSFFLSSK